MQSYSKQDSNKAQKIIGEQIQYECTELPLMPVGHALVGKRREGCKCSAEPCGHQQSPTVVLVVGCPCEHISDNHTAHDVDRQRPVRESVMMRKLRGKVRNKKTGQSPEDSTDCHAQCTYQHDGLLPRSSRSHQPDLGRLRANSIARPMILSNHLFADYLQNRPRVNSPRGRRGFGKPCSRREAEIRFLIGVTASASFPQKAIPSD